MGYVRLGQAMRVGSDRIKALTFQLEESVIRFINSHVAFPD